MPDMGLAAGAGGGMAYKLFQDMLARRFAEQQAEQQQGNVMAQLGLNREKLTEDRRQFDLGSEQRGKEFETTTGQNERKIKMDENAAPIRNGLATAQTHDLERKPEAERVDRQFKTDQDKARHGYQLGEIAAQGQISKDVASMRSDNGPVVRIQTVDEDGNDVIRVMPRGDAARQGTFAAGRTTDQRNRAAAGKRSGKVIDAISELSEKINVNQGVYAKMAGGAAQLAAKANLDDDVAEYDALISGFTPLVARALGHVGVLTEQDVQSVRKVFPSPTDSKSLRNRKIARLNSLLAGLADDGAGDDAGQPKPDAANTRKKWDY